ncbi:hypothetical protein [Luteolibacter soli]|uniref:Uncharacterized protein n=1 Tax=Luteolibacter soli TaxID=3135280 RepID=A0ABU9AXE1_9BACT
MDVNFQRGGCAVPAGWGLLRWGGGELVVRASPRRKDAVLPLRMLEGVSALLVDDRWPMIAD